MITDAQTNFVWFSELLRQKPEYHLFHKQLVALLQKHSIPHDYLQETNDIWCRDYMPVQVSPNNYVDFRYDPDYLLDMEGRNLKTYADVVCESMGLKARKSNILLDGGNVIKGNNCIILTDKVLIENRLHFTADRLIGQLSELFEVDKVVLIPCDPDDEYGHADGMIRYIDDHRVLINGYFREYKPAFKKAFFGALEKNGLDYIELKYDVEHPDEEINWAYINYLHMENLLLIPQLGLAEDTQAWQQISRVFPEYAAKGAIEMLDATPVIQHGGGLNCVSWNVKI